jgi:hypothetical protein
MKIALPIPTADGFRPSGPTIKVSTSPIATHPISATTTGAASEIIGRNSSWRSRKEGSIGDVRIMPQMYNRQP